MPKLVDRAKHPLASRLGSQNTRQESGQKSGHNYIALAVKR
jgi:hypothetical protein